MATNIHPRVRGTDDVRVGREAQNIGSTPSNDTVERFGGERPQMEESASVQDTSCASPKSCTDPARLDGRAATVKGAADITRQREARRRPVRESIRSGPCF